MNRPVVTPQPLSPTQPASFCIPTEPLDDTSALVTNEGLIKLAKAYQDIPEVQSQCLWFNLVFHVRFQRLILCVKF